MVGYIYKITNLKNGKQYIGQTSNPLPEKRIKQHFRPNRKTVDIVSNAVQKYGLKFFTWEIICICPVRDLDEKERYYISVFSN